ncbi:Hypothetical predicted protein [Pelobates cultripes]|uniref:Uncharacterized protein n=1 Tax=Pelobates cultripes TaxID=61616 RepID=A0AAD1RYT6_PELCU|nr:Hypothetical predicted protein [Pelobates cultripes]
MQSDQHKGSTRQHASGGTAKAISLDGVNKPTKVPPVASRDFTLRFQHKEDRAATMAVVKNLPQYSLEAMSLSFFTDLSGSTLAGRRSLKPLTTLLKQQGITYHLRLSRSLLVTHGRKTHEIHDLQGAQDLLPIQDAIHSTTTSKTTKPRHRWNPERVKTFVPHLDTAPMLTTRHERSKGCVNRNKIFAGTV